MTPQASSSLSRFKAIALLEGLSFLILLFIAMPLKYAADMPLMVKYTGWAHGVLFVAYIMALAEVAYRLRWSIKTVILAFMASLIPFGPFLLESRILKKQQGNLQ